MGVAVAQPRSLPSPQIKKCKKVVWRENQYLGNGFGPIFFYQPFLQIVSRGRQQHPFVGRRLTTGIAASHAKVVQQTPKHGLNRRTA